MAVKTIKLRAYTQEEVRARFLDHMWGLVKYWDELPSRTPTERLEGLMHSTLSLLDEGTDGTDGICAFKVIPHPYENDREFHRSRGENWYTDDVDIAGSLHELVYRPRPAVSIDPPTDR